MNKFKKFLIRYSIKKRRLPDQNRKQVGKNLSVLAIFLFFLFLINFAMIIGTDKKFGVTLSDQAKKSMSRRLLFLQNVERSMTEMEQ